MPRPFNAPKPLPSAEILKDIMTYDADAGTFTWTERGLNEPRANWWNSVFAGKSAGHIHTGGYTRIMIDGLHHFAHRIAWKIMTGEEPVQIDHINGDTGDNRFANLRDVSHQINSKNRKLYKNNTSGIPGVMFHERDKVWISKVGVDGVQVQLGSFDTKEEAIAAIIAAHVLLDYHANHGRSAVTKET